MRVEEIRSEEKEILLAHQQNDFRKVATIALDQYGNEIMGFLVAYLKSRTSADDVFSEFLEDFWVGLPGFEWRCSLRAWAYTLARHAATRYLAKPANKPGRVVSLDDILEVADIAKELRNTTPDWMRSNTRREMQALRESLLPEDQVMLILRVDRGLSWRDLVSVMSEPNRRWSEQEQEVEIQKWRKRFERIKTKLKRLAEREGLLQKFEKN